MRASASSITTERPAPCRLNYTVVRTLRALELLTFGPASAPTVADALGVDARTARRLLNVLVSECYVERRRARSQGRAWLYAPTVRLPALSAQLARRLSLVRRGEQAVRELHERTGVTAFLVVPAYRDVLVLARAGSTAPWSWDLLPAPQTAAGRVLLAYRARWRDSVLADGSMEQAAVAIRDRGYELDRTPGGVACLAAPVGVTDPIAALAASGPADVIADGGLRLVSTLAKAAGALAEHSADDVS